MNAVDVRHTAEHEVTLEWTSGANNDMIADATLGLLAGVDKSPASVRCKIHAMLCWMSLVMNALLYVVTSECVHVHARADAREQIAWFLEAHFGEVELGRAVLTVRVDGEEARIDLASSVSWGLV